jgi:hypothetical protein
MRNFYFMKRIALSKRGTKHKGKFALVDDEDFDFLNQYSWNITSGGYVIRYDFTSGKQKGFKMHNGIISSSGNLVVDHINRDKLDNQRCNLRLVNQQQNAINVGKYSGKTSIYKGVSYKKENQKWHAQIQYKRTRFHLGYFDKEHHAAMAYDIAAKTWFGKYAYLNFISVSQ